jgi:heterodisulfide reductase subunit A-like polyferredoxin
MVEAVSVEKRLLPVVFFPDGTYLIAPNNRELAEKVGLQTRAAHPFYDLAIIGAGPAGLAAAVYGASEGLRTVMIEREASGQAGTVMDQAIWLPKGITDQICLRASRNGVWRRDLTIYANHVRVMASTLC